MLRWLANEDKHRLMHAALVGFIWSPEVGGIAFSEGDAGDFELVSPPMQVRSIDPFQVIVVPPAYSTQFLRIRFTDGRARDAEVRMKFETPLDVAFGQSPRVVTVTDLSGILGEVRLVIRLLEPFLR